MSISPPRADRVALLGFGVEGAATLRALRRWGFAGRVSVLDDGARPEGLDPEVTWEPARDASLADVDLLIKTPGIKPSHPAWQRCLALGLPFTTATNLYLAKAREAGLTVVGVTGSKGKSTSASLLHRALLAAGRGAALVGNIGHPALDALDDVLERRAVTVFEMSSYQCSTLVEGPELALVTNLFPEHLDWHGDVETYYADKLRIATTQRAGDRLVWNAANAQLRARVGQVRSEARGFNVEGGWRVAEGGFARPGRALSSDGMLLRGAHNRENACGVLTALELLGVDARHGVEALRGFAGLPHRLEDLGAHGGVRWVNDSISTAPEAAVAALEAYSGEVASLIMGGFDRGYDFTPLAHAVRASGLAALAALAPSGPRLLELLEGSDVETTLAADLDEAVRWIAARTPPGRTCVFSPASPSYGRYRDFIERGEHLRGLVAALG
ncbi:MAG: UDP-N-acetylmuramoyl-L-alanine--D-glutamate ligase [Polyangiales bacterium]